MATLQTTSVTGALSATGTITGSKVYNSVFNDIADYIELESPLEKIEYGKCYIYDNKSAKTSSEYCQKGVVGIVSDTYGYGLGVKNLNVGYEIPIAVAGFVLAYVEKSSSLEIGDALTSSVDGYLTKIKEEDKCKYPERILATFFKFEDKEKWHDIEVNGRVWVKVK